MSLLLTFVLRSYYAWFPGSFPNIFLNLWKILQNTRFEPKMQHLFLKNGIKEVAFHLGRFFCKYKVKEVKL